MTLNTQFDPDQGTLEILPDSQSVPEGSFKRRNDILSVSISEGLEAIEANAFAFCENLKILTLPQSLISIGKEAFFANFSLERLLIPGKVKTIGDYSFQYNRSLESIEISDSVTSIGKRAFSNNWILNEVNLGNSLKSIGEKAFYRSPEISTINIPDSVVHIGEDAFAGTGIKTVILPNHFADNPPTEAFEPGTLLSYRNDTNSSTGILDGDGWESIDDSGVWTKGNDDIKPENNGQTPGWSIDNDQKVDTLPGNDTLIFEGRGIPALTNNGKLKMNKGRDLLRLSIERNDEQNNVCLSNMGTIHLGKGRDQIDLLTGALSGEGKIKLGAGNDAFSGFGQQDLVHGGKGKDLLRLPAGTYEVNVEGKILSIKTDNHTMKTRDFEFIGGIGTNKKELLDTKTLSQATLLQIDELSVSFD